MYKAMQLEATEKQELAALFVEANKVLTRASMEKFGKKNIKKLRAMACKDSSFLWAHPAAKRMLALLKTKEDRVVRGHIKLAAKLCKRYASFPKDRPGATYDDYLQEAAIAIIDAMYSFDGSTQFTTYAFCSIRNRLVDFIRKEKLERSTTHKILSLEKQILVDKRSTISQYDELREMIARTDLTDMERTLLEERLNSGSTRGLLTEIAATQVNPRTNKLYSKQALSLMFTRACSKVRMAYSDYHKVA